MPRVGHHLVGFARPSVRCFVVLLAFLIFLSAAMILPVGAAEPTTPPTDASTLPKAPEDARMGVVLLCNLENNQTLYEKNAASRAYPSSTVKIMTGLLACRALSGRLDESVTVTGAMVAGVTGRKMHLVDGEVLTVRDLLFAAIAGSYNDAACVLACLSSGSVSAFVADMNAEAVRLGATSTRYTNPTGLHDPAMSTSAQDVALIAREAYDNDLYMTIASVRTHTIPATNASPERFFSNRNALISDSSHNYFNGHCRGMNVGMTDEGGWSLVTVSERDGAHNLCIILSAADAPEGELIPIYLYANRLLSWAHQNYKYRTVLRAGDTVKTVPVGLTGVSTTEATLFVAEDLKIYLPVNADEEALSLSVTLTGGELVAPVAAGQIVGSAAVNYGGVVVGRVDVIVTEDFERSRFLDGLTSFRGYLCSRAFWISVAVFVSLLLPFLHMTGGTGGRYGIRSTRRRKKIRYKKRRY